MAMFDKGESFGERLDDTYQEMKDRLDEKTSDESEVVDTDDRFGERIQDVPPALEEEVDEADPDVNDRRII
jgi:hypothetical protein